VRGLYDPALIDCTPEIGILNYPMETRQANPFEILNPYIV